MALQGPSLEVSEYFDNFKGYDSYYKGPWKYYRRRPMNIIRKKCSLKQGTKVLDLGCGKMCSLPNLLLEANIDEYHCVDLSTKSLEELNRSFTGNKKIKVYESDIIDFIETCREKYEIILLFGVIMYLSRSDAIRLSSALSKVLSKDGMILIHEPNEKSKGRLDAYGCAMTHKFLNDFVSAMPGLSIAKIENYNIAVFRKLIFFLFKKRTVSLNLNRIGDFVWYLESLLELMLAGTKFGCDSMIVLERDKP